MRPVKNSIDLEKREKIWEIFREPPQRCYSNTRQYYLNSWGPWDQATTNVADSRPLYRRYMATYFNWEWGTQ